VPANTSSWPVVVSLTYTTRGPSMTFGGMSATTAGLAWFASVAGPLGRVSATAQPAPAAAATPTAPAPAAPRTMERADMRDDHRCRGVATATVGWSSVDCAGAEVAGKAWYVWVACGAW